MHTMAEEGRKQKGEEDSERAFVGQEDGARERAESKEGKTDSRFVLGLSFEIDFL